MAADISDEQVSRIEYEVITENLGSIIGRLEHELYPMCVKFFENRLISEFELGNIGSHPAYEAATGIMRSIMTKVKADPNVFYAFVSAFEGSMSDVAVKLNAALEKKKDQCNPWITSLSDQPFVGREASLGQVDDAPGRSSSCPEYSKCDGVSWTSPETVSGLHETDAASAHKLSELQSSVVETAGLRTSHSDTELLRYCNVEDSNHAFTEQLLHFSRSRSNSCSEMVGSRLNTPFSGSATSDDVSAFPVEETSRVKKPWEFVYVVNEDKPWQYDFFVNAPLANMRDQNFWSMDRKVARDMSIVECLEKQLVDKKK